MKRVVLGFIVSVFFLYLVLRQIDYQALAQAIRGVNYFWVAMAIGLHFIGFYLRTLRWKFILRTLKEVRVRELFPYLAIGYMANNVLFLRLGEVVRAHITGRRFGLSRSSMIAVILAERLYDGLSLVILFSSLILFLRVPEEMKTTLLFASILFGIVALGVFLLPWLEKTSFVKKFFSWIESFKRLKRPFLSLLAFLEGLKTLKSPLDVMAVLGTSLLIWLIEAGMFYLIAIGFGLELNLAQTAVISLVAGLSTLIPSGPGYVGTFEFFFVQSTVLFGIDRNVAVSYAFLTHFAQWLPITLLGFYYAWKMNISVTKLSQEKRSAQ
jgi:uncharacterized protein (TIRG00374 family)